MAKLLRADTLPDGEGEGQIALSAMLIFQVYVVRACISPFEGMRQFLLTNPDHSSRLSPVKRSALKPGTPISSSGAVIASSA